MELNYRQGEILDLLQRFRDSDEGQRTVMAAQFKCKSEEELLLKLVDMLLNSFEDTMLNR